MEVTSTYSQVLPTLEGRGLYKVAAPEGGNRGVILDFAHCCHCGFGAHGHLSSGAEVNCEEIVDGVAKEYRHPTKS